MLGKSVKQKKNINNNKNKNKKDDEKTRRLTRFLITINVQGSSGPLRFVVKEEDLVSEVIDTALKCYARERRLPLLGSDTNSFLLYCSNVDFEALRAWEAIGCYGARNFVLYRKQAYPSNAEDLGSEMAHPKRSHGSIWKCKWKTWFSPQSKTLLLPSSLGTKTHKLTRANTRPCPYHVTC